MFRLTRQVRFAINSLPDDQLGGKPSNAYGGFPSVTGLAHYFTLDVTLHGPLDPQSQYVRNIKDVDDAVRRSAIPLVASRIRANTFGGGGSVVVELYQALADAWPGVSLEALRLGLSPFLSLSVTAGDVRRPTPERSMVRLSQKFEFSASHRLHNPGLTDDANRQTFGKCNNPYGHGHNYEVQVTLVGEPDNNGALVDMPAFERTVGQTAIDHFDHKNLNVELPEFQDVIPSVENIARVIYRLLKPKLDTSRVRLASVTVWETPKTWCEYSEE